MPAVHTRFATRFRPTSAVLALAAIAAILVAPLATPLGAQQSEEEQEAGRHLGHIMSEWEQTPEGQGLLAVAIAETQVASRHATLAVRNSENLEAMKTHARHVLHALDPTRVDGGPGLGYGVIRVARDIGDHMQMAVEAMGYSGNIANRAPAVTQSADNVVGWAEEMIAVIEEIQAAETPFEAEPLVRELRTLATHLVSGRDLNGDDEVRWQDGEGGIMHVQQHMSLLMRVDGRWYHDRTEVDPEEDGDGDAAANPDDAGTGSGHSSHGGDSGDPNQR